MFSSIITTNIKLSSKFNYKGFNFGIKIGDFMKKILCYLLISNLLISQDNVESLKEEALPNEDNVIENCIYRPAFPFVSQMVVHVFKSKMYGFVWLDNPQ